MPESSQAVNPAPWTPWTPWYSDIVGDRIHGYPVIAVAPDALDPNTAAVILLEKEGEFVTGYIYSHQYAGDNIPQTWDGGDYLPFNEANKKHVMKTAIMNMATRAARIRSER